MRIQLVAAVLAPACVFGLALPAASWQETTLAKARLLAACEAAAMGREVCRRAQVLECIEAVEPLNPTPRPLEAPELLSGCWRLVYTTSRGSETHTVPEFYAFSAHCT